MGISGGRVAIRRWGKRLAAASTEAPAKVGGEMIDEEANSGGWKTAPGAVEPVRHCCSAC